jgi:hypothetical protein
VLVCAMPLCQLVDFPAIFHLRPVSMVHGTTPGRRPTNARCPPARDESITEIESKQSKQHPTSSNITSNKSAINTTAMDAAGNKLKSNYFVGFLTAKKLINSENSSDATSGGGIASAPPSSKKVKTFGGFSSAKDVMNSFNSNDADNERGVPPRVDGADKIVSACDERTNPEEANTSANADRNNFNIDLLVRGLCYHKENILSLESISIHREPNNMFDANAIAVHNDKGGVVGHVAREQAVSAGRVFNSYLP